MAKVLWLFLLSFIVIEAWSPLSTFKRLFGDSKDNEIEHATLLQTYKEKYKEEAFNRLNEALKATQGWTDEKGKQLKDFLDNSHQLHELDEFRKKALAAIYEELKHTDEWRNWVSHLIQEMYQVTHDIVEKSKMITEMDAKAFKEKIQHMISHSEDIKSVAGHVTEGVMNEINSILENHGSLKHLVEVSQEEISHIFQGGKNYSQHALALFEEVKSFIIKNQVALVSLFMFYFTIVTIWRVWALLKALIVLVISAAICVAGWLWLLSQQESKNVK